ncbi:Hvo_1808 family surface protein [Halohasta salina]|uniref:Hvo_1808 family surface protein n=1 Tax=Halohasta salina TaxID=2961621 RepID=UPI0020A42B75|nr:Hvo_1808 family surface protein [Halohasta salina]
MSRPVVIVVALLLVTAGLAPAVASTPAAASTAAHTTAVDHGSIASTAPAPPTQLTETEDDRIGCVDGVCHDDDLDFETTTNLSAAELDVLVDRTMARVEELRGEEFTEDVSVEVQSRAAFRKEGLVGNTPANETFDRWNDVVWKALFVVGDDREAADAIDSTVGGAVNGFYDPNENRIVIITPNAEAPTVSERTLLHELTHAMQDQRHDLGAAALARDTQDADLAVDGVVEGEAVYLETRYEQQCEDGNWACFDDPRTGGTDDGGGSNSGLLFLLLQPYSDGPGYIHETVDTEGWDGVDERLQAPPRTTSEIIHREPVESTRLDVPDESTAEWERYPAHGVGGAEVAGEASIYVMLWYQARTYDAETIDPSSIRDTDSEFDRYNYVSEPSDGWVGDELVPYRRGDDDGYVWTTEWETAADAAEFQRAYGAILDAHDATETESGAYEVSNGSFSGVYAVETDRTRVRIVHAPTEAGLFELDPTIEPTDVDDRGSTDDIVPGFGVAAAVAALLAVAAAGRRLS